jgi:hypothetical protein
MRDKYEKDGLVCISVSVDEQENGQKALAFLDKQRSTFPNYLIDEPTEVWQKKLDVSSPPGVIVIDRDGKRVKRFTSEELFTYEDVEKVVAPLLKEKAR